MRNHGHLIVIYDVPKVCGTGTGVLVHIETYTDMHTISADDVICEWQKNEDIGKAIPRSSGRRYIQCMYHRNH
jgi:hypothetical protein